MKVLYILGNGFDRSQGMATGYSDFYKHLSSYSFLVQKHPLLKK